jgi:hypothetical protein
MNVLGKIERHLRKTGKKPTRFGREAANDPRLVFDVARKKLLGKVRKKFKGGIGQSRLPTPPNS